MWLPADERQILTGLYYNIQDVDKQAAYYASILARLFKTSPLCRWFRSYTKTTIPEYGDGDPDSKPLTGSNWSDQLEAYFVNEQRVCKATKQLVLHGLVKETQGYGGAKVLTLELTASGYDLGRRYANWFDRTGLAFREYKDHWFWLIVAFVGGGIASRLIDRLFP